MRVFVTGASGFVGSAIVRELLQAGHRVTGLARTDQAADQLFAAGADVHRGNLDDLESLKTGTAHCDAVIHTAFNHDFSRFKANCEADRQVILALGEALAGTDRPLVVTSGVGLLNYGRKVSENDTPPGADQMPRAASEEAADTVAQKGGKVYVVRLPPTVHDRGDHGFVPMLIGIAREKNASAYIGQGQNHWPAVHRLDAAVLYRLIVEQQPARKIFHAVAEQGIVFKELAEAIGNGLGINTVSKSKEEAADHFSWFAHFAAMDCPASGELTKQTLAWEAKQTGLLQDLKENYFNA
ncbi:SDR family oxidoreductase [Terrimonas sp. NA20]|uniref:SDR family oxidoreductase n=1 Tax=Terrimonas ginsenosidimutans TaxID=2908004 RepID=A0ABS9L0W8_9BACT|nr:SDR family oxidoreductase [Terrimonas ginsenosidimutans]MCG2618218.1 SDR family oxidoreductase [Terrimonas ginsenosidimutans]